MILTQEETDALLNPLRCLECKDIIDLNDGYYINTGLCISCTDPNTIDLEFWERLYCKKNVPISITPGLMDVVY